VARAGLFAFRLCLGCSLYRFFRFGLRLLAGTISDDTDIFPVVGTAPTDTNVMLLAKASAAADIISLPNTRIKLLLDE
jgi:hypothetical protein